MRFTLTIDTDSAAFDDNRAHEIARILREIAGKVEESADGFSDKVRDFNGNICGFIGYSSDEN